MRRKILHSLAFAAATVAVAAVLFSSPSRAGLASSSLIAEIQSIASPQTILAATANEFMVLDADGRLVWRGSQDDAVVTTDLRTGSVRLEFALPEGLGLELGHEFVWRCDARRVTVETYMRDFIWVDKADVAHSGYVSARPIQGNVGEAQVRD